MVNMHSKHQASATLTPVDSSSLRRSSSARSSPQALANEISLAFSQILQQLGIHPGSIKLTSGSGSGQTTPTSPSLVSDATKSSAAATPILASSIAASQLGFNALVPRDIVSSAIAATTASPTAKAATEVLSTVASSTGSSGPIQHWYSDNAVDNAYWKAQPAAVRQLREIDDMEQRQALAADLASKGYSIDNAIMVWGWGVGNVTAERQSFGYTWVPSAAQANVTAAPGLTGPGMTPYDPNNPPARSIKVPSVTA